MPEFAISHLPATPTVSDIAAALTQFEAVYGHTPASILVYRDNVAVVESALAACQRKIPIQICGGALRHELWLQTNDDRRRAGGHHA
jgi:hypothetical protein